MARFNVAILEVKNFNESVAMSTLKKKFQSSHLIFSLNKNFSDTYAEMLDRICKYAQAEEEEAILRQAKKDKIEKKRPRENDERTKNSNRS